ncbi:DUF6216 family protein [Dyella koreensis]|uniref:DUF3592 domain-containing protein n=1 Tax=Dyella koreensis TaxID=311235 RepID=A0ABW8K7T8_9GAMM
MLEIVSAIPGWAWTLLHLGAIGLLLLWLCWRSGSPHMLLARLWSLVHGKPQPGDRVIRAYLASRSTLMQFRAVTGVRCRTLEDTRRLIAWTVDNNEEIGDVARCGNYFDLRKPGLKLAPPKRWEFITSLLITMVCGATLILAISALTSQRAWVSVKNGSGKGLLLAPTNFEVWSTARHFTAADCKTLSGEAIAKRVGLPVDDVSTACGWFGDPELQPLIDSTVRNQHLGLSFLIGLLLGYGLPAYRWFTSAVAARGMSRRLERRVSEQPAAAAIQAKPESGQDA